MPYLSGYEACPPFLSWQPPSLPQPRPPLSWQPPSPPQDPTPPPLGSPPSPPPQTQPHPFLASPFPPPPPALKVVREWEGVGVWPVATAPL